MKTTHPGTAAAAFARPPDWKPHEVLIFVTDGSDVLKQSNPALARICGYTPELLCGQPLALLWHPATPQVLPRHRRGNFELGLPWVGLLALRHRDGSLIWTLTYGAPVLSDGQLQSATWVCFAPSQQQLHQVQALGQVLQAAVAEALPAARQSADFMALCRHCWHWLGRCLSGQLWSAAAATAVSDAAADLAQARSERTALRRMLHQLMWVQIDLHSLMREVNLCVQQAMQALHQLPALVEGVRGNRMATLNATSAARAMERSTQRFETIESIFEDFAYESHSLTLTAAELAQGSNSAEGEFEAFCARVEALTVAAAGTLQGVRAQLTAAPQPMFEMAQANLAQARFDVMLATVYRISQLVEQVAEAASGQLDALRAIRSIRPPDRADAHR